VAPLPTPHYFVLGAAVADEKIYFFGHGISERYDPPTNIWSAIAPMPVYNSWATVTACQNKIYVIGGLADKPTQVYDPATNTWANRTSIPQSFCRQKASVVGDKIYVMGGAIFVQGIIMTSSTNYVYDLATDSWSTMAPIPMPVEGYASAVLDDKIYIIGGGTTTGFPIDASKTVQIFDPESNQWSNGTSIPTGVSCAGACTTSGLFAPERIYVVGGTTRVSGGWLSIDPEAESKTDLTQVYDPATGEWSLAAPMLDKRWFVSLVNVDDLLYAVGGQNGSDDGIYVTERSNMTEVMQRFASTKVQATVKYIPIGYDETPAASPTPTADTVPAVPFLAVSVFAIVIMVVGLLVYFKKRKRQALS
jgi:N-acetylneuraminic acid mutarotase